MLQLSKHLSCPIVREANIDEAEAIATMIIESGSKFIDSVFAGNKEKGFQVLLKQFSESVAGVHILTDGEEIVGVMKLHLPNELIGNTISYSSLIRVLGLRKGIRAGILLSHWDEYSLAPHEAYIEYMYSARDWPNHEIKKLLLEKAYSLADAASAKYITHFIPDRNYQDRGIFENEGFIFRRKIHSVLAKILGSNYTSWYKATYTLIDGPITVKEYVVEKIDIVKQAWMSRRREVMAALRLTIALTIIPVVAGYFAYIRGYELAVVWWVIIGAFHLGGVRLYLHGSAFGRYGLATAMVGEGINLLSRSIATNSWFDRSWLLATALLTFWICYVVLRTPGKRILTTEVSPKLTG